MITSQSLNHFNASTLISGGQSVYETVCCVIFQDSFVFLENLLSNVLSMLSQVQNRAIPKPPFNRVFQGGTGRGTNGSIQQRPKC